MSVANPVTTIPGKADSDISWKAWYESLPFSESDNNVLFTHAWQVRGSDKANTENLRSFLKENGINLTTDSVLENVWETAKSPVQALASFMKMGSTAIMIAGGMTFFLTLLIIWRLATPQSVGVIAGTAVKTAV